MAKHTVRVPPPSGMNGNPSSVPRRGHCFIPGLLATAGGQSLKEITKALQVAKFDSTGW
jgi:hypothetical protein